MKEEGKRRKKKIEVRRLKERKGRSKVKEEGIRGRTESLITKTRTVGKKVKWKMEIRRNKTMGKCELEGIKQCEIVN